MRQDRYYRNTLLVLTLGALFAATGWTQDAEPADDEDSVSAAQAKEVPTEDLPTDDIDVDDGSYLDAEEEDFRPSEEISADQSIPFPTDI